MSDQRLPTPPNVTSEFYAWLWWTSEQRGGTFDLGGDLGRFDLFVDERLAFRAPGDTKISAVMTGESPGASPEARAALSGGKMLQELRVFLRRDEREYSVTLRGPELHFARAKVPSLLAEGDANVVDDRLFVYDELHFLVGGLFREFARVRTGPEWRREIVPALRSWLSLDA
jgi:hypothetical protein